MMTSSASLSSKYWVCRLPRGPMAVVAVVLLYTLTLVFRQADEAAGFMALRGATSEGSTSPEAVEEETLTREEIEVWDPLPDNDYAQRGPVKGGVEVYPLQVCKQNQKYGCRTMRILASFRGRSFISPHACFFHHLHAALMSFSDDQRPRFAWCASSPVC